MHKLILNQRAYISKKLNEMKMGYQNILGKKVKLTAFEGCYSLETAISEGIMAKEGLASVERNIYNRSVLTSSGEDLAFAAGLSATGLRTAAFLRDKNIVKNALQLEQAVRQNLPMVVVTTYETQQQMHKLADTGAFQLWASNAQEAADFLLIAHRVSELSLIPGIVAMDVAANQIMEVILPSAQKILSYLGNPDTRIGSPTPAQEMIFGTTRRRIPNWYNPDVPVMTGAQKNSQDLAFESVAKQQFLNRHLQEIIYRAFDEFSKAFGRKYQPVDVLNYEKAEHVLITTGLKVEAKQAAEKVHKKGKVKSLHLNQVYPFPAELVAAKSEKARLVTVLEQCTGNAATANIYKEVAALNELRSVKFFSGKYGNAPSVAGLEAVLENMLPSGQGKQDYWLDIPTTIENSAFPKHQVLLQAIAREYPESKTNSILSKKEQQKSTNGRHRSTLSSAIKKFTDNGPAYSRLTRFYDDTAALYDDEHSQMVADPYKAIPVLPAGSAGLANLSAQREMLPVFDPKNCSGFDESIVSCPHSALLPTAIGLEELLQSGMKIATSKGTAITQLTPMVKNLAKMAHKEIRERKDEITTVADIFPAAFQSLTSQMNLEGEKLIAASNDFNAVMDAIGILPVAITDVFYNKRDSQEKGSGLLFTMTVDPSACTGCGVCAAVCENNALAMQPQTAELEKFTEEIYSIWEMLPDTPGEVISGLIEGAMNPPDARISPAEKFNPFAALMLSRSFTESLRGGSISEKGSSQKAILNLVTTAAEAAIQPKVNSAIKSIKELIEGLSQNIQNQLGDALPKQDFEALSEVLNESAEDRISFEQMIDRWGSKEHLAFVDKIVLQRKVNLSQALKDLLWALKEGPTGAGRSRFGVAMDAGLDWANQYPWNNFSVPVVVSWDGTSPEMAKGLVHGQIRHLLDNIKLLRRAKLEVKNRYDATIHDNEIASITWNDLLPEEKDLMPPILLVGRRSGLAEKGMTAIVEILDSGLPVKVVVLDDAVPAVDKAGTFINDGIGMLLPAMALQKAFVIKSSLADPVHLFGGLQESLQTTAPALMWLLAPDHEKHSLPLQKWMKLNGLAHNSRAFINFRFQPAKESKFISSKLEIVGNPAAEADWPQSKLVYAEEGEEKSLLYKMTWADWAYSINGWKELFKPYHQAMGEAVPVADYLGLDVNLREGKVPVICRVDAEGELKRYMVSEVVIEATEACLNSWNVLRELAGELTQFPEKLHKQVEKELAVKYDKEQAELRSNYEKQIADLEQAHLEKVRLKLKEKLMAISRNGG